MQNATSRLAFVALMSAVIAVIIVTFPLASLSRHSDSSNQDSSGDSAKLKETTDWLKEKLLKHINLFELKDNRLIKADRVQFDGCKMTLLEIESSDMPGRGRMSSQREVTIPLKDIDPSKITAMNYRGNPSVVIETKDRKPKIDVQIVSPGIGSRKQFELYVLSFRDKAISFEVAKKLSEAATLCQ